jgi:hypothetical protein
MIKKVTTTEFHNNKGEIIPKNTEVDVCGCSEYGYDIRDIKTGVTVYGIGWVF